MKFPKISFSGFANAVATMAAAIVAAPHPPCMQPLIFNDKHIEGYIWYSEGGSNSKKDIRYVQLHKTLLTVYVPKTEKDECKYGLMSALDVSYDLKKGHIQTAGKKTLEISFPAASKLYISTETASELELWNRYLSQVALGGPTSCKSDEFFSQLSNCTEKQASKEWSSEDCTSEDWLSDNWLSEGDECEDYMSEEATLEEEFCEEEKREDVTIFEIDGFVYKMRHDILQF